jgi:hypothetical protein
MYRCFVCSVLFHFRNWTKQSILWRTNRPAAKCRLVAAELARSRSRMSRVCRQCPRVRKTSPGAFRRTETSRSGTNVAVERCLQRRALRCGPARPPRRAAAIAVAVAACAGAPCRRRAASMSTGVMSPPARSRRQAVNPSSRGMRTSSTTKSGRSFFSRSRASTPSLAATTSYPSKTRLLASDSRTAGSSSTTRTRRAPRSPPAAWPVSPCRGST